MSKEIVIGDEWTVIVLYLNVENMFQQLDLLMKTFDYFCGEYCIPHYTLRCFLKLKDGSFQHCVSFRTRINCYEYIDRKLRKNRFKDYRIICKDHMMPIDMNKHAWVLPGQKDSRSIENCKILHKMSKLAIEIGLYENKDRWINTHLFCNMIGLKETVKTIRRFDGKPAIGVNFMDVTEINSKSNEIDILYEEWYDNEVEAFKFSKLYTDYMVETFKKLGENNDKTRDKQNQ